MAVSKSRKSSNAVGKLRSTLERQLDDWLGIDKAGRQVAVGYSGGRDSLALLDALVSLRATTGIVVSAIHVNHGLNPLAERWGEMVRAQCKALGVEVAISEVTVPRDSGLGIEGAARKARYQIFGRSSAELLLLGHHQEDQAETLILNLLRGAGVYGAAAMPELRLMETASEEGSRSTRIGRPWLGTSRYDIDKYIKERELVPIDDQSNSDISFNRNYLRHEVFPRLTERYPQASATFAKAARKFSEARTMLEALADIDLGRVLQNDGANLYVSFEHFSGLDMARQRNLLRRWLSLNGEECPAETRVAEFLRQCREAGPSAATSLSLRASTLRFWRSRIYLYRNSDFDTGLTVTWQGERTVTWGKGELQITAGERGLRADALSGHVEIRPGTGSERIRLSRFGHSRTLRQLFQELQIPPWRRQVPVLWIDGRLAAVAGVGIDIEFLAEREDAAVTFDWIPT